MTRTLPSNAKAVAALAAFAWTTLSFGAALAPAPAQAAEADPFYRAELAAPTAEPRPITGDLVWSCSDTSCAAGKGKSRPAIVCARLAKEVGPVANFVANGKALDEAQLARCNAA